MACLRFCFRNQDLLAALLQLEIPIVTMPSSITRLLIQEALLQPPLLIPALLREKVKAAKHSLPALGAGSASSLLEFAASDILEDDEESAKELFGMPLVPLLDGTLASLAYGPGQQALFLPTTEETELFKIAAHYLVDLVSLAPEVHQK